MREAGLIEGQCEAKVVIYYLAEERVRLVIDVLARIFSEDVPPRLAGADPGVALPLVSSWASFARLPPPSHEGNGDGY